MISVKNVLIVLAVAFTAYLAARGLSWTAPVSQPLIVVTALALYLASDEASFTTGAIHLIDGGWSN